MPRYNPQTWYNDSLETPANAARMTVMENGILDAHVKPTGRINCFLSIPTIPAATVVEFGSTAGYTTLTVNEDFDTLNWHPGAGNNPGNFRIGISGIYLLTAYLGWPSPDIVGTRYLSIVVNSLYRITASREKPSEVVGGGFEMHVGGIWRCNEGDKIGIQAYHTAGSSMIPARFEISWSLLSYG